MTTTSMISSFSDLVQESHKLSRLFVFLNFAVIGTSLQTMSPEASSALWFAIGGWSALLISSFAILVFYYKSFTLVTGFIVAMLGAVSEDLSTANDEEKLAAESKLEKRISNYHNKKRFQHIVFFRPSFVLLWVGILLLFISKVIDLLSSC